MSKIKKEFTPELIAKVHGDIEAKYAPRRDERICLSYWHPRIEAAGFSVPETRIVHTDCDLLALLEGEDPGEGFDPFITALSQAVAKIGTPCFLRTGQTSGKHEWSSTCYIEDADRDKLVRHVAGIVNYSAMADFMGLATDVWAVRELIPTTPLFICEGYCDFPVVREFRVFADSVAVDHIQPYWPPEACERGRPSREDWRVVLAAASRLELHEDAVLSDMAVEAAHACDGKAWSVDFLQDADGFWWITDMAPAEVSFRWDPKSIYGEAE